MIFDASLQSEPSTYRPHALSSLLDRGGQECDGSTSSGPTTLLIQVPTIPRRTRAARPASEAARAKLRSHGARPLGTAVRRRRLRREIRVAGGVLATLVPLTLAFALLLDRPSPASARRPVLPAAISAAVRPPAVSIMLDSSLHAEPESTVVFPGYLLPDEGAEEPAHAGG